MQLITCYKCITTGYDSTRGFKQYLADQHILFSDGNGNVPDPWLSLPLNSPKRLCFGHDINRFHKIFPHHVLPKTDISVYLDGNVEYLGSIQSLVDIMDAQNASIGFFRHPDFRILKDEATACHRLNKFDSYDRHVVQAQLDFYANSGFDILSPIAANGFIVRKHSNEELKHAMTLWWGHLFEYTKRDQMSLMYCLWNYGVNFVFFDDFLEQKNSELIWQPHHKNFGDQIIKRVSKRFSKLLTR